jgi:glycosyltransferase involved in cell wall biosynthesis
MTTVAFPLLGRGGWTGGLNYLKNTLRVIRLRLAGEIEAHVFLSPEENARFGAELAPLVDGRLIVNPSVTVSGRGKSLVRALITGRDEPLEQLLMSAGIDVAFENASFYGARFAIPIISWMPDFQHRHMPEMFSRLNWWRRDLGFRLQIRSGRTIMLSSETARDDLKRFYPASRGRGHVVRFAIELDIAPCLSRGEEMRATYGLPQHFLFLPNQFWRHKNHIIVIAALARLRAEGVLAEVPPVVLTGQSKDPRHPAFFDELMAEVNAAGVGDHFRYLGLVPYDHVMSLNAACTAMINPSRFEGWSTPIEEAKAFATPLVLSDITIHREQAPDARFFDPASTEQVAQALIEAARKPPKPRPATDDLVAAQERRLDAHASSLLATVRATVAQPSAKAVV